MKQLDTDNYPSIVNYEWRAYDFNTKLTEQYQLILLMESM